MVFVTRVFDFILVILGSHLLLDWFYNGIGQNALLRATVVPLWQTLKTVARAAEMLQTLRSTKKLQNDCFSKLFVRASGYESLGCSGALTSVLSSYARTKEDIIVSRLESGEYAVLERVAGAAQKWPRRH